MLSVFSAPTREAGRGGRRCPGIRLASLTRISSALARARRRMAGDSMGWFNPATGEIVVRENSWIDTVLHELGWHATYAWARDNAPELFAKMREYAEKAPQEVKDAVKKRVGKVVPWRLSCRRPKIPPPTHFYHQPATTKRVSCGNWVGGGSQVCCGLGWW